MANPNYVAFLRGINVGKRQVQMTKLKSAFEKMGYPEVRTVLATGNVIFYSDIEDVHTLTQNIEDGLQKIFGFSVRVIVRSIADIKKLLDSDPFKGIKVTADTRLYVTFLSDKHESSLKIPYLSPDKEFKIIKAGKSEVLSILVLGKETRTVEAMSIVEKEYGKSVTTRNWNTVVKVAGA